MVPATDELPEGVIFVLKNINNSVNADNRNRIHPFYMVYIGMDGQIVCDYLNPKKMLDDIRSKRCTNASIGKQTTERTWQKCPNC